MNNSICQICHHSENHLTYTVYEMMFGYRDVFEYFKCSHCGCLQIQEIPENIEKYYPKTYWGKQKNSPETLTEKVKRWVRLQRTYYLLSRPNFFGKLIASRSTLGSAPVWSGWDWISDFKRFNLDANSSILDVGCGVGSLLNYLKDQGFSELFGVEPYAPNSLLGSAITIYNQELKAINRQFDFICLHHSFEHMANPHDIFKELYRLLKPQRYLLLRIPVVSSFAWEKYQENWVQLDAPRHFFLHTPQSVQYLCDQVGFEVNSIIYDSNEFQFWASEQYLKGIPLNQSKIQQWPSEQIQSFRQQAKELNQQEKGDQACFYLYKS